MLIGSCSYWWLHRYSGVTNGFLTELVMIFCQRWLNAVPTSGSTVVTCMNHNPLRSISFIVSGIFYFIVFFVDPPFCTYMENVKLCNTISAWLKICYANLALSLFIIYPYNLWIKILFYPFTLRTMDCVFEDSWVINLKHYNLGPNMGV